MSEYGFTKKEWVLFREKIADWQEAYMDKLKKEYIELLSGEGNSIFHHKIKALSIRNRAFTIYSCVIFGFFLNTSIVKLKRLYYNLFIPKWRNITMSEYGFTKKDWALFREKIADWQEAYMDKLNKEYIELLSGEGKPSEKFWA